MTESDRIEILEQRVNELYRVVAHLIQIEGQRTAFSRLPILHDPDLGTPSEKW